MLRFRIAESQFTFILSTCFIDLQRMYVAVSDWVDKTEIGQANELKIYERCCCRMESLFEVSSVTICVM